MKLVNIVVVAPDEAHNHIKKIVEKVNETHGDSFAASEYTELVANVLKAYSGNNEKSLVLIHEKFINNFPLELTGPNVVVYTMHPNSAEINHPSHDIPYPLTERAFRSIVNRI